MKNLRIITIFLSMASVKLYSQEISKQELFNVKAYIIVYEKDIRPSYNEASKYKAIIDKPFKLTDEAEDIKLLMENTKLNSLGSGVFLVSFSKMGTNLYRINNTDFVIETTSHYLDTYSDFYFEISNSRAFVKKKNLYEEY